MQTDYNEFEQAYDIFQTNLVDTMIGITVIFGG